MAHPYTYIHTYIVPRLNMREAIPPFLISAHGMVFVKPGDNLIFIGALFFFV
jgi:hypothetical protein